jgi:hypothetical protein
MMAYLTEFVDGGRGVTHVASGVLAGSEILAAVHAELRSSQALCYSLADLSGAADLKVDMQELTRIAEAERELGVLVPRFVVAFVVPSETIRLALSIWRSVAASPGWRVKFFAERQAAVEWLRHTLAEGVPPVEVALERV